MADKDRPPLTAEDVRCEAGVMGHWIEDLDHCETCGLAVEEMARADDIPPCEEGRMIKRATRR